MLRFLCVSLLLALAWGSIAGTSEPYRHLRAQPLTYQGPDQPLGASSEIVLGWFAPTNSSDGTPSPAWWAACLAVQEANSKGGLAGVPFRLQPCWTPGPWTGGAGPLSRMVYDHKPLAILGSADSASTHLAEQIVAKANLPLVSFCSTDPSLTLAGVPWMFSCAPSDRAISRTLVSAILKHSSASESLAMVAAIDHDSRMMSRALLAEFSKAGRLPAFKISIDATQSDPMPPENLRRITVAKPSAVLIVARGETSKQIAAKVSQHLPDIQLFTTHTIAAAAVPTSTSASAPKVICPQLLEPQDYPAWRRFADAHEKAFSRPPAYEAAAAYDATRLLIHCATTSGPSRALLRDSLAASSPWRGVSGIITFDGTGQNTRSNFQMTTTSIAANTQE